MPATASLEVLRRVAVNKELQRAANILEWEIEESDISICTHPDGSDYLLGAGGFGKVRMLAACHLASLAKLQPALSTPLHHLLAVLCA